MPPSIIGHEAIGTAFRNAQLIVRLRIINNLPYEVSINCVANPFVFIGVMEAARIAILCPLIFPLVKL